MSQRTNAHDAKVTSTPPPLASWYAQGLSDGLGDRLLMFDNSAAPSLELLRFHPALADAPGFESALREQVERLARFQHPAFARIRSVQRLDGDGDLALLSNHTPGKRLSDILHRARGPAFAAAVIRQLAPALANLQQHTPGAAHGLLSPDRIVVSPEARVTIVEHVIGPAIDRLHLERAELASMGIAVPSAADGESRLDTATDWYQLGLVAVSVLMGRPVSAEDLPQLGSVLDQLCESAVSDGTPLSPFVREWLDRSLQLSGSGIHTIAEAREALDDLLHDGQPRNSARVVPLRPPQATLPAAAPVAVSEPAVPVAAVASTPQVTKPAGAPPRSNVRPFAHPPLAAHASVIETFPSEPASGDHRLPDQEPFVSLPPPSRPRRKPDSVFEVRAAAPFRQPAPSSAAAAAADRGLSPFEREAQSSRPAKFDIETARGAADPDESTSAGEDARKRTTISASVIAALLVVAAAEAGVIVWLAGTVWLAPPPPLAVETAPAGGHVVVTDRSAAPAPLKLAAAPDLRWARVTAPSALGIVGGPAADGMDGSVRISSPIALKVLQGTRVLGSVPGAELRMPAGRHEIELVNAAFGYRLQQTLEVEGGQTVFVHVAPPPGWVTIEAPPGAEVSVDGQAVGRTPLDRLPLAAGEHQLAVRLPSGGIDRQRVTVKPDATTRVVAKPRS